MRRNFLLPVISILLCCAAHAETPASLGKVFYAGKTGFFSKTSEYKIEAKNPNISIYSGNDVLLFDSKSFALIHIKNAPADFDPSIQSSSGAGTLEIGNTWTGKYLQPATPQSQCNRPSEQEFSATVSAKEAGSFDVAGTKVTLDIFEVKMTGTWASCGYNGTWTATRKYAPSLGIFTLTDSQTLLFDGRVIAGGSMKLDHIER